MGRKAQTYDSLLAKADAEGDCFIWNRCKDRDEYGVTAIKGIKMPAHRAVMSFLYDVTGTYVLHKCTNRACINPDHLYLGTQKQNVQDQIDAGTFVRGSKNGKARLTEDQVYSIRASNLSCRELATIHNYSYYGMWDILKGRSWKHLL